MKVKDLLKVTYWEQLVFYIENVKLHYSECSGTYTDYENEYTPEELESYTVYDISVVFGTYKMEVHLYEKT